VEDSEKASFEEYQNYIKAANTRGCTDFVKCFTWMDDFCQKNKNKIEELTVIFFTDGLDNCNHKQKIRESFE
jgi:Mg-chelatase subunit ChlD